MMNVFYLNILTGHTKCVEIHMFIITYSLRG